MAAERRGVAKTSIERRLLGEETLDQVTNGHSGRDGMWIDNQVWSDAFSGEWQVFLSIGHTAGTFLTVSRGELVSDLRDLDGSHFDFDEQEASFVICEHDLVDNTIFRVSQRLRSILIVLLNDDSLAIDVLI